MAKNKKKAATPAQKQPVNPMKDGPEEEAVTEAPEGAVVFESEEVAGYAADAGKNGDDLDGDNSDADTSDDKEETVNFASDEAGEFYAENEDTINLDDVKGTGKDGAITKGDLKKALPKEGLKPADEPKTDDSFKGFLEEFIKFGLPVKGALRHKPLVQERWNDLYQRALKIKETL